MFPMLKKFFYGNPEPEAQNSSPAKVSGVSGPKRPLKGVHMTVTDSTITFANPADHPAGKSDSSSGKEAVNTKPATNQGCQWNTRNRACGGNGSGSSGRYRRSPRGMGGNSGHHRRSPREQEALKLIRTHHKMGLKPVGYAIGMLLESGQYKPSLILLFLEVEWLKLPEKVTLNAVCRKLVDPHNFFWEEDRHPELMYFLNLLRNVSRKLKQTNGRYFPDMFGQAKLNRCYRLLGLRPDGPEYSVGIANDLHPEAPDMTELLGDRSEISSPPPSVSTGVSGLLLPTEAQAQVVDPQMAAVLEALRAPYGGHQLNLNSRIPTATPDLPRVPPELPQPSSDWGHSGQSGFLGHRVTSPAPGYSLPSDSGRRDSFPPSFGFR